MATTAEPAEYHGRVEFRADEATLTQLAEAARRRDWQTYAEILGAIGGPELLEQLAGHVQQAANSATLWRRRNPGATRAHRFRRNIPRRGHVGRPRRPRPRSRALIRSSGRGGDSGDSADDPEPAGPGDPVGDTSRVHPSSREGAVG